MDHGSQGSENFSGEFFCCNEVKRFRDQLPILFRDGDAGILGESHPLLSNIDAIEEILRASAGYQRLLALAKSCPIPSNAPWAYQPLIATRLLSVGLLTVFRIKEVPLHDHPRSFGIQMLLHGNIQISVYRKQENVLDPNKLVRLTRHRHYHLKAKQYSCFSPEENIHQLVSQSERSVLLSIISPPLKGELKSWYFPVNPFFDDPENLLAYRSAYRGGGQ